MARRPGEQGLPSWCPEPGVPPTLTGVQVRSEPRLCQVGLRLPKGAACG